MPPCLLAAALFPPLLALMHSSSIPAPPRRHRAAVRVSKQWHAACYAPALLQNLHIGDELQYEEVERWSLERLAAYCAWLARRRPAQHARSVVLRLLLPTSGRYEPHIPQLSDAGLQEREYLAACLAAIGSTAGSQLRALELSADCAQLSTGAWPAGLTALTSLALDNHSGTMWLSPALRGLTGLEELWLRASDGMEGEANLPPGVTRLLWEETRGLDLPESVSVWPCWAHAACIVRRMSCLSPVGMLLTVPSWNACECCAYLAAPAIRRQHLSLVSPLPRSFPLCAAYAT